MHSKYILSGWFIIALCLVGAGVITGQGCSQTPSGANQQGKKALASERNCVPPAGQTGSPQTIAEAIDLINSLPKPVSVPCYLESLDRPLKVSLTTSIASAQPAAGMRSPRVFILSDQLITSIVPDGQGAEVIEFSQLTAPDESIKGELDFPVLETLPQSAPYDRIRFGSGTLCGLCHRGERLVPEFEFTQVFASGALKPTWDTLVKLESLRNERLACNPEIEPERCAILRALFDHGEVIEQDFPSDMPSL